METESKEGFLMSSGYRIHYLLWGGSGPKLVFLHSMGMDAHGFDTISKALEKEYQILALDILDHGDSDTPHEYVSIKDHAEIIRDCYSQLGFCSSILIGHSVGGMMGMVLAAEHPGELKGLVLVDIAPFEMTGRPIRPPPPEYFNDEEEARTYFRERYAGFTPESVKNRVKHALTKDEKGRLKLKPTGAAIRPGLATDLWPYVERIRSPTLLILGSLSTLVTQKTIKRMKKSLPDLKVASIQGATHMVPQDKPEEFEKHLRVFLEELQSE